MNIFISISTLDYRECEEKFLFLISISESLKLKFSFILGTPGSQIIVVFLDAKKSFAGYTHIFFGNFYFYSRQIWALDLSFSSRNWRCEFQISLSTLDFTFWALVNAWSWPNCIFVKYFGPDQIVDTIISIQYLPDLCSPLELLHLQPLLLVELLALPDLLSTELDALPGDFPKVWQFWQFQRGRFKDG